MVVSEEMLYQLGDKFISSHIYSVMPEERTVPVVQESYSKTIPGETPVTVQMKENQLHIVYQRAIQIQIQFRTWIRGNQMK